MRFLQRLGPTALQTAAIKAAAVRANGRNGDLEADPWLWSESFAYDSRNNRTEKTNGWGTISYAFDEENRLLSAGKRTYDWDANGNMIEEARQWGSRGGKGNAPTGICREARRTHAREAGENATNDSGARRKPSMRILPRSNPPRGSRYRARTQVRSVFTRLRRAGFIARFPEYIDCGAPPVDVYTQLPGFVGQRHGTKQARLQAGVRYEYDAFGRKVERSEYQAVQRSGGYGRSWTAESATNYLYDGLSMEVLAEARDWDYNPGEIGLPHLSWWGYGTKGQRGYGRGSPLYRPGQFCWTGSFKPESEYVTANGETLERNDYSPTKHHWGVRTDTEYYTADILGSTMMLTDRDGKVRERYEYDASGALFDGTFGRLNSLGYNGKRYDAGTGLYDYGFRDYAPRLGRFTTVDPVRDGGNWYAYVGNDPINYTDPTGELFFLLH
ncbi:MAG: hypothetical protein A2Z99_02300 [Treponema sp. GWB1_62_6]|nr:MAG: hypothetical protein A2001_03970 [Treponema sp. GWC1_61_84]OHE69699.1 MAG: hypothetical protein A2Z99_02300 [Treponema sp. GWB1_62_6]HCM27514.1 hypothetical protein [Treponema sp.]